MIKTCELLHIRISIFGICHGYDQIVFKLGRLAVIYEYRYNYDDYGAHVYMYV